MRRAGSFVLVAAALAMMGYRFLRIDLASFRRDEPQFLAAAREQLRSGRPLAASPLYGNMGIRYGPTAFWFYGIVQLLLGDDPRVAILAMGLLITLAQLAFALGLTRALEGGATFFAVLVAALASSPYEYYWSRLAWDLTSNAGIYLALALLCLPRALRSTAVVSLGLVLGLALSTHAMVAPFALAVALALAWELRRQPRRLGRVGAQLAAAALAVSLPYVVSLVRMPIVQRAARQPPSLPGLSTLFLQAPRVTTTWGFDCYFDGDWVDFQAWLGPWKEPAAALSLLALVAFGVAAAAGTAAALRSPDTTVRRMGLLALLAWVGTVLLLAGAGLEAHAHYHFSCAWVPVFGAAAGIAWLRRRHPRAGDAALALLAALGLGQFLVVVQWMGYVDQRGGTRAGPYGTPLGAQMEAMRTACAVPETRIVIENDTTNYGYPFEYLATTLEACRGKRVLVCSAVPRPLATTCPPMEPESALLRLSYAGEKGGFLRVERAE